jgi:hypothetical protein
MAEQTCQLRELLRFDLLRFSGSRSPIATSPDEASLGRLTGPEFYLQIVSRESAIQSREREKGRRI